jgi:hypothetical protein
MALLCALGQTGISLGETPRNDLREWTNGQRLNFSQAAVNANMAELLQTTEQSLPAAAERAERAAEMLVWPRSDRQDRQLR